MQPEKLVVFGPIVIFFGFFGLLVLGFVLFIVKIIRKTKNSYWKGKVVDKKYSETEDMDDRKTSRYILLVEVEGSRARNVEVSRAMYDSCKVGDMLEKPLGKLNPIKVAQ